jgi:hypothetical protein
MADKVAAPIEETAKQVLILNGLGFQAGHYGCVKATGRCSLGSYWVDILWVAGG